MIGTLPNVSSDTDWTHAIASAYGGKKGHSKDLAIDPLEACRNDYRSGKAEQFCLGGGFKGVGNLC